MFNWTENITVPKLTDVINTSDIPVNVMRIFTYPWIYYFGGWIFAAIIGVLGAALYIKYDNAMVPVTFFILMIIFFGAVLRAEPVGPMPSAAMFVYIIGILACFAVGFVLYQLFVSKEE